MTNEASGNRVLAFARHADGSLGEATSVATHGLGSGDSLGSQAALALTGDRPESSPHITPSKSRVSS
jgi:hypothetical protein